MQKHFLFFSLFFVLFLSWSPIASAKKKYRYIKREHGVRFQWNNPMSVGDYGELTASVNIQGAYTYNWRGMLEAGPYFKIDSNYDNAGFNLSEFDGGFLAEYNIIKNRGKRKLIPAVGLSVGANSMDQVFQLALGLHGALKVFVAKRTPFVIMLGCKVLTPMDQAFQVLTYHPYTSMGFSYYFDFY